MSRSDIEPKVHMTQPASVVLRVGTIKIHDEVTKNGTRFIRGELVKEEYIRFLMMLWHIYKALEEGLAANAYDEVLSPTYNPSLLPRCSTISSDISCLLGFPDYDTSWKTHEANRTLVLSSPPALRVYTFRLKRVAKEDPRILLAHSYIRYLGDLSGGQIAKWNIREAYGLEGVQGTRYYSFGNLDGEASGHPTPTSMGEIKKIKEWFKSGMDIGVGNNIKSKEALLNETTWPSVYTQPR